MESLCWLGRETVCGAAGAVAKSTSRLNRKPLDLCSVFHSMITSSSSSPHQFKKMIGDRGHDLKDQDKILLGIKILPRQFRQKCWRQHVFFTTGPFTWLTIVWLSPRTTWKTMSYASLKPSMERVIRHITFSMSTFGSPEGERTEQMRTVVFFALGCFFTLRRRRESHRHEIMILEFYVCNAGKQWHLEVFRDASISTQIYWLARDYSAATKNKQKSIETGYGW